MAQVSPFDFDLFVIGAGSGGLTAANRAAQLGKRVAVADFVTPTPSGTTWGVGGTCLNVGCIPKKLMHYAALLGEARHDQAACGWTVDNKQPHSWEKMLEAVSNHIRSSNWKIKVSLSEGGVQYFNALARFHDAHTLVLKDRKGSEKTVTAERVLIAVGGRPTYPDTPGCREHCISSDDLFWLPKSPGKTLVIGAGYIGMECAGFMRGLGCKVELLHRGKVLSQFDDDMAERVKKDMRQKGVKFTKGVAVKFSRVNGRVRATKRLEGGEETGDYDTVLVALGRRPSFDGLGLERIGLKANAQGKLVVDRTWQTNVAGVFAIGDVTHHNRELTPVAIKEAIYLVRGLYKNDWKTIDYETVATTVFTPLEYALCGLSEREAIEKHGSDDIEVYHSAFKPLEWKYVKEERVSCYCKVITRLADNKVLGIHLAGPGAGEIMSGFSVLVRRGVSFDELQDTIGIHPTMGEEVLGLELTKRASPNAEKNDC